MILGAIPLAIASGAGAESRQQIGWVIVGGMSLGTLLTLFVVPCVYAVMGLAAEERGAAGAPSGGGLKRHGFSAPSSAPGSASSAGMA
jgi:multidrug efflux pump